jgi:hypothetical protein
VWDENVPKSWLRDKEKKYNMNEADSKGQRPLITSSVIQTFNFSFVENKTSHIAGQRARIAQILLTLGIRYIRCLPSLLKRNIVVLIII